MVWACFMKGQDRLSEVNWHIKSIQNFIIVFPAKFFSIKITHTVSENLLSQALLYMEKNMNDRSNPVDIFP